METKLDTVYSESQHFEIRQAHPLTKYFEVPPSRKYYDTNTINEGIEQSSFSLGGYHFLPNRGAMKKLGGHRIFSREIRGSQKKSRDY